MVIKDLQRHISLHFPYFFFFDFNSLFILIVTERIVGSVVFTDVAREDSPAKRGERESFRVGSTAPVHRS